MDRPVRRGPTGKVGPPARGTPSFGSAPHPPRGLLRVLSLRVALSWLLLSDRFVDLLLDLRAEHRAPDRDQLLRLLARETLEETLFDAGDVRRAGLGHGLETAVGQSRVRLARVRVSSLPLHEPTPLESVDQPGQTAAAEDDRVRELEHPQPP